MKQKYLNEENNTMKQIDGGNSPMKQSQTLLKKSMRTLNNFQFACSFLLSALMFPLLAQETQRKNDKETDTIIVEATRSKHPAHDFSGMTSIIEMDAANMIAPSTLSDIFASQPWITITKSARRNGQTVNMRGYSADRVLILFDGIRQNFDSAHDGKFFIDSALIKRVEIVRGASSSLYGSGALGGVIAFQTFDASDLLRAGENFGFLLKTAYQSSSKEYMESSTVFGRTDTLDILVNINWRSADDVRLGDGSKFPNDERIFSGLLKLGWMLSDHHALSANFQIYQGNAIEPNNPQGEQVGITTTPALFSEVDKDNTSYTSRLNYEYENPNNNLFRFSAKTYMTQTAVKEEYKESYTETVGLDPRTRRSITQTVAVGDTQERKLDRLGVLLDAQTSLGKEGALQNILSYGIDYYTEEQNGSQSLQNHSDITERGGVPDAKAMYMGVYLQDEINWNFGFMPGEILLVPGIRLDEYNSETIPKDANVKKKENKDSAASPKVGLTYKPLEWLSIFGNYAEGFRAPTMTEIYATGRHFAIPAGPIVLVNNFVENEDLKPEKSRTYEGGLGFQFKNTIMKKDVFEFKFSYYKTQASDFIDIEVSAPDFRNLANNTTQVVNREEANLSGSEFELSYKSSYVYLSISYSDVEGKYRPAPEEPEIHLTSITPAKYVIDVAYKIKQIDSIIGLRNTTVAKHDEIDPPQRGGDPPVRDSYSIYDIYYQYAPTVLEGLVLKLGIDNVGDKEYSKIYAGSLEPGSNYKASLSYQW